MMTEFESHGSKGYSFGGGVNTSISDCVSYPVRLKVPAVPKEDITLLGLKPNDYTLVVSSWQNGELVKEKFEIEVKDSHFLESIRVISKYSECGEEPTTEPITTQAPKEEMSTFVSTVQKPKPEATTQVDREPDATVEKPAKIQDAEELILDPNIDKKDGELSPFYNLKLQIKTGKKKSKYYATLNWKKIANADGYIIYGSKCGKTRKMKKLDTITNNKTTKWTQSKLKKGTYYKYIVVAYKGDDVITTSKSVHVTTPGGKKGNPTGIKLKKTKMTLKVNKPQKINAKVITKKKYSLHIAEFRYESSNPSVATVSDKGKVKAISKGTATIYVYTQNGLYKKVKVKVK